MPLHFTPTTLLRCQLAPAARVFLLRHPLSHLPPAQISELVPAPQACDCFLDVGHAHPLYIIHGMSIHLLYKNQWPNTYGNHLQLLHICVGGVVGWLCAHFYLFLFSAAFFFLFYTNSRLCLCKSPPRAPTNSLRTPPPMLRHSPRSPSTVIGVGGAPFGLAAMAAVAQL